MKFIFKFGFSNNFAIKKNEKQANKEYPDLTLILQLPSKCYDSFL